MFRFGTFVAASILLALASRRSLRVPGSHGFHRFFAWECILALCLLNFVSFAQWFADPFSARQLVSWVLLFGSLVPASWGAVLLRTLGVPDARRPDDGAPAFAFEKTTRLVTTGIYRHIRHPLYCSLLIVTWGVFLKRPSWVAAGAGATATAFLVATARAEERENLRYFGPEYRDYVARTRMFIPFVI